MQYIKQAWVAGNELTIIIFMKGCCSEAKEPADIYTALFPVLLKDYTIVNLLRKEYAPNDAF